MHVDSGFRVSLLQASFRGGDNGSNASFLGAKECHLEFATIEMHNTLS